MYLYKETFETIHGFFFRVSVLSERTRHLSQIGGLIEIKVFRCVSVSINISAKAAFCMLRAEVACNLKMEAADSSEKSVPMYQTTRPYNLEDRRLNAYH